MDISGFLYSKKGVYKRLIYTSTNNVEVKMKFFSPLFAILSNKGYGVLSSLIVEFTPLIQETNYGQLVIDLEDNRKILESDKVICSTTLCIFKYQAFVIQGIEWASLKEACPWQLKIRASTCGLKHNTMIGKLRVTPTFNYVNGRPLKDPFRFHDASNSADVKLVEETSSESIRVRKFAVTLKGYALNELEGKI
ncbi:TPA_asm: P3 [Durio betacytorhabdovirus 1]|nr:TPA_asm: P3 [Durio betacytorhabdovirus 1]